MVRSSAAITSNMTQSMWMKTTPRKKKKARKRMRPSSIITMRTMKSRCRSIRKHRLARAI